MFATTLKSARVLRYQSDPSNPVKPQRSMTLKYGFSSILLHQFHVDVRRPSTHEPPSSPAPSNPCRKKSRKIANLAAVGEANAFSTYLFDYH